MINEVHIENFLQDHQFRLAKSTMDGYQRTIKKFLSYHEKPLEEISKNDIRDWMMHLELQGKAPSTRMAKLCGLKTFFRYCLDEKLLKVNPTDFVPFPKIGEKLPYYLDYERLNLLRRLVKGKHQERAIIEVLYATGVRISELHEMKKDDIDWENRIIYIHMGKGKKGRIVLFTRACEEYLKVYLETRTDNLPYVFVNRYKTKQMCTDTIQERFNGYSKELGFRITPHTLRHTFTAHLAIRGMPLECIQVLLGHVNPQQTQYYARLYSHSQKQKYDEFF